MSNNLNNKGAMHVVLRPNLGDNSIYTLGQGVLSTDFW